MKYPKIKSVRALDDFYLELTFDNEIVKKYDCKKFMKQINFKPLNNIVFFKSVHVDTGGYGIIWNDDIDLAESELWINGIEVPYTSLNKK